ncbi:MAG: hypothetical protein F7C08_00495 [Desulfurococcales archaeon]|nr:hypothetical protein [Desulfurococcales archaeon]MCE4605004.1 hypothetical protein [Desulfurococcales archaeon]
MQTTTIAGIVIALIIGLAIGYTAAPGAETLTTTVTSTVTQTTTETDIRVMVETETEFRTVTNTITVPITVTSTVTETLNPVPPLEDLQKGVTLRLKVGSAAGKGLAELGFKNIAVVAQSNLFCIELGSVLAAVFTSSGGIAKLIVVEPGVNEVDTASLITDTGFEAVVLAYGGNSPPESVVAGFKSMVSALMDSGYKGAVVVHAAAFANMALQESLADDRLCGYLKGVDVYVYLPNPDEGKLEFFRAVIEDDCKLGLEPVAEVNLG